MQIYTFFLAHFLDFFFWIFGASGLLCEQCTAGTPAGPVRRLVGGRTVRNLVGRLAGALVGAPGLGLMYTRMVGNLVSAPSCFCNWLLGLHYNPWGRRSLRPPQKPLLNRKEAMPQCRFDSTTAFGWLKVLCGSRLGVVALCKSAGGATEKGTQFVQAYDTSTRRPSLQNLWRD